MRVRIPASSTMRPAMSTESWSAQLMSFGKLQMVHVPYKGEPPAIPDLLDARVHMMFGTGGVAASLVKRARALATLLPVRAALLGRADDGRSGDAAAFRRHLGRYFGPAKMPKDIVERLSREVNAVLQRPEVREQFERQGVQPGGSTPAEFGAFLQQQLADWGRAAREAGLKPE